MFTHDAECVGFESQTPERSDPSGTRVVGSADLRRRDAVVTLWFALCIDFEGKLTTSLSFFFSLMDREVTLLTEMDKVKLETSKYFQIRPVSTTLPGLCFAHDNLAPGA